MTTKVDILETAEQYASNNLFVGCTDLLVWRKTGRLPPNSPINILTDMLRPLVSSNSAALNLAHDLFNAAALEHVANGC